MTQWREIEYQQTEKAQEIEISFGECEIEENKWSSVEVKNAKHIQICTQAQPRTMLCHCQCSAGRNWNETGFDCCFCCCFFLGPCRSQLFLPSREKNVNDFKRVFRQQTMCILIQVSLRIPYVRSLFFRV